jgi:hypothetical protein
MEAGSELNVGVAGLSMMHSGVRTVQAQGRQGTRSAAGPPLRGCPDRSDFTGGPLGAARQRR